MTQFPQDSRPLEPDELPAAPPHNDNPTRVSYWGFSDTKRWYFPDNQQFIEYKRMSEGDKARFQRQSSRDFILERGGDSRMKVDIASDRHALLEAAVVGWHLYGENPAHEEPFNPNTFKKFLSVADPKFIEDLEKAIRKFNPWLMADMSVADIDRELESLQEMRAEAVKREEGEGSSSSR